LFKNLPGEEIRCQDDRIRIGGGAPVLAIYFTRGQNDRGVAGDRKGDDGVVSVNANSPGQRIKFSGENLAGGSGFVTGFSFHYGTAVNHPTETGATSLIL
jgi:hypothetical protein